MSFSGNSRFDELKTTGKLPSPSGVALAIIELCRKDGVTVDEIAHAVRAEFELQNPYPHTLGRRGSFPFCWKRP